MGYDTSPYLDTQRYSTLTELIQTTVNRFGDKPAFVSLGKTLSFNEIENVLANHEAVMECAVIGVPDEHSGEAVKAVVVLTEGVSPDTAMKASIEAYCRSQLAAYKVPKFFEFVEQLPKSTVGKILRRKLRES